MSVKCLSAHQKAMIADWYKNKIYTQRQLSDHFEVSERTINRVLEEKGLATPVARIKGEAYQVMQVVKAHSLDAESLKARLAAPALSFENVQVFLNQCSKEQLAHLFYHSGLVKIAELLKHKQKQTQEATAHAKAA